MAIETTTMPDGVTKNILKEQNAQTKALNKNIQGLNSTLAKKKAQSFLGSDDYEEKSYKRSNKVQSDFDKKVEDDVDTLKKIRQEIKKTEEYFNDSKLLSGKALGLSKYQFASMQRTTLQDSYSKMMSNILDKKREMLKDFTYMRTAEGQASLATLKSEEKKLQLMRKQERLQKIEEEYQTELGKQLYGLKNELKGSSNMLMGPFRLLLEPLFGEEGLSKIVNEGIGNIFGRRKKPTGKATDLTEYKYRGNSDYESAMSGLGTNEYESKQFDERLQANAEFKDIDKIASRSPNSIKAKEVLKFNSAAMGSLYVADKLEELLGDDKAKDTNVDFGGMLGKINIGNLLKNGAGLAAIAGGIIMGVSDGLAAMNYKEVWNTSGAATFIGGFLGGDPASAGTMEGFLKNAGKGGLMGAGVGLMVGGPMGAIAGFLIGGAIGGVMSLIGPENIAKGVDGIFKFVDENKSLFLGAAGALGGLLAFGPVGAVAGGLLGFGVGMALNSIEEDSKSGITNDKLKLANILRNPLITGSVGGALGAGVGAAIGSIIPGVGTFIGAAAGFLLGSIAGIVVGAVASEDMRKGEAKKYLQGIVSNTIEPAQMANMIESGMFDTSSDIYKGLTEAEQSKVKDFLSSSSQRGNISAGFASIRGNKSVLSKEANLKFLLSDEKDKESFISRQYGQGLDSETEKNMQKAFPKAIQEKIVQNMGIGSWDAIAGDFYGMYSYKTGKDKTFSTIVNKNQKVKDYYDSLYLRWSLASGQNTYSDILSSSSMRPLLMQSSSFNYDYKKDSFNSSDGVLSLLLENQQLYPYRTITSFVNKDNLGDINKIKKFYEENPKNFYFHSGGYAPSGKDEYPSILQKGELVLTESQAKYYDKIINEDLSSMKDTSQYMRENTKEIMEELLIAIKKLSSKLDNGKMSNVNQTNIISRYDMNSFTNSLGVI